MIVTKDKLYMLFTDWEILNIVENYTCGPSVQSNLEINLTICNDSKSGKPMKTLKNSVLRNFHKSFIQF